MAEKYFGHAPRELRAAAVARYLTTDLTLEEVGEQFGTHKAQRPQLGESRCREPSVEEEEQTFAHRNVGQSDSPREAAAVARSLSYEF
jgi:transposase-like protein